MSTQETNAAATSLSAKGKTWRIVSRVLVVYLLVVLVLSLGERFLVYPASVFPEGDWDAAERHGWQDIHFKSRDGTPLHGWLAEAEQPVGLLLYCHGNAGNVTHRSYVIGELCNQLQLTVFIFDYRGYGKSAGKPYEAGILDDARAARQWLADKYKIDVDEIILLGRSLGGGVATRLAAEDGARALILESTFTSLVDAAADNYWFLPVRLVMRNRLETAQHLAEYKGPLLISHGTEDEIIPYRHGQSLFAAATSREKQFYKVAGATHNEFPPDEYYRVLGQFLRKHVHGDDALRQSARSAARD